MCSICGTITFLDLFFLVFTVSKCLHELGNSQKDSSSPAKQLSCCPNQRTWWGIVLLSPTSQAKIRTCLRSALQMALLENRMRIPPLSRQSSWSRSMLHFHHPTNQQGFPIIPWYCLVGKCSYLVHPINKPVYQGRIASSYESDNPRIRNLQTRVSMWPLLATRVFVLHMNTIVKPIIYHQ